MADSLTLTNWIGEVVNNQDPKQLGRCKIRVFGKFDLLDEEYLPWATPMNRQIPGAHAIPRIGDIVSVRFENGNIYQPEYGFQINQDLSLKEEVLEISDRQQDVISIVYDSQRKFRIYFSPEEGLIITLGNGQKDRPLIQIDNVGDIRVSSDSKIFLDSANIFISNTGPGEKNEEEPAVKGVSLENWLNDLLSDYQTHTHPTSNGTPTGVPLPPTPILVNKLKRTHKTYQQRSITPRADQVITGGTSIQSPRSIVSSGTPETGRAPVQSQPTGTLATGTSTIGTPETGTQRNTRTQRAQIGSSSTSNFITSTPWSAAFISYVMKDAGVSFPPSALHTAYLNSVLSGNYPFKRLDPAKTVIKNGDLIFLNRAGNNQTFGQRVYTGPSHVDIVVEIQNNVAFAIGGNVSNAVFKSQFSLVDKKIASNKAFAILRPNKKKDIEQIIQVLNREYSKWKDNGWKELDLAAKTDLKKYYDSVGLGDSIV